MLPCELDRRVYDYETQVVNGMIPNSPLRNGLKLSLTAIWVRADCNGEVLVNFTNVKCFSIDQSVHNVST